MTKQTLNNTINSRIKNIITKYKKMKSVQQKLKALGPEWVMCHRCVEWISNCYAQLHYHCQLGSDNRQPEQYDAEHAKSW